MNKFLLKIFLLFLVANMFTNGKLYSQYQYPFQNPKLDAEKRIDNIISLFTLDEKILCLGTNPYKIIVLKIQ